MAKTLVTGASGFLGRRLVARLLERGAPVVVLTRDPERARAAFDPAASIAMHAWSPEAGPPPKEAFDGVETVVHLAGETVAGRWNAQKKDRIQQSRVLGTLHLVEGMRLAPQRASSGPRTLVSSSAIGFYGDRGDERLEEGAAAGDDFLAGVCKAWEEEAGRARAFGVRVVTVRTGIVLGADGGALAQMLTPFKLGVGGPLGGGQQWMSWIHQRDQIELLLHAADAGAKLDGPMNAVAPAAVRNREFARVLGQVLHRPAFLPTPRFALRAAFGEFATVLLASQQVIPTAAQRSGFRFAHPELEAALRDLLARPAPAA